MIRSPMRALVTLPTLCSVLAAQSITWLEGPGQGAFALRTVAEATPDAPPSSVLTGLTILPIEITGRTRHQDLDPTRARRLDVQGLVRVELPDGGRLLAYRRGTTDFGFLRVGADGTANAVLEAPGPGGTPFVDRIGVGADGRFGAVADVNLPRLSILRLDGGVFASTNRPWRTVTTSSLIEAQAVMVGATHVFFATDDERLWRCPLVDGGVPQDITPPPIAGARLKSEMAMSGDGRTVAFLYGVQPNFGIYLAHEALPTRRLPLQDAKYEEPGYLPEFATGPRLLLDATGASLLFVDATIRDEAYLLDTTGARAMVHVTGDANFQPYIGAVILPVFAQSVLFLGVGNPDHHDVYAAAAGVPSVVNLTQTNGNTRAPFGEGILVPENVAFTTSGQMLVAEHTGTSPSRVRRLDFATGTSIIVADDLAGLHATAAAPPGIAPDLLLRGPSGDLLLETTNGTPRLRAPVGVEIAAPVHLARWSRALTARVGTVSALVFHANDGSVLALPPTTYGQRAFRTSAGNLLIDGATLLHVDSRNGPRTVQTNGATRHVLSGAGA